MNIWKGTWNFTQKTLNKWILKRLRPQLIKFNVLPVLDGSITTLSDKSSPEENTPTKKLKRTSIRFEHWSDKYQMPFGREEAMRVYQLSKKMNDRQIQREIERSIKTTNTAIEKMMREPA